MFGHTGDDVAVKSSAPGEPLTGAVAAEVAVAPAAPVYGADHGR